MNPRATRAEKAQAVMRPLVTLAALLLLAACGDRAEDASTPAGDSPRPSSTAAAASPQTWEAEAEAQATSTSTSEPGEPSPEAKREADEGRLQMMDPEDLDRMWAETTNEDQGGGPMAAQAIGGFDDEIKTERAAQRNLPTADGPTWAILRKTRISIDEKTQLYHASHPADVRALAGRRITLRGYMLPLEANDRTTHFLISPYTPVCFFHPPAEPNEIVEVNLRRSIAAGYHLVEISGVLQLADNGEKGLFFVMEGAEGRIVQRIE